jgi:recombination protein RecT
MSAVTNAVAKAENGIEGVITTYKPRLGAVLPDHINVDQFAGLAMGALYRDPKLREAATNSPGAFMNALMRCASLGHQPGTEEFYLIPRKNKGQLEVQGMEGYRGIVERMYRSGAVASVVVREVCAMDKFEYIEGVHDKPQHTVNWFGGNRGEMIGVYAYAQLTTGATSRVVILSRDDVMAAKANSDAGESSYSPWNRLDGGKDHPEFTGRSMWWKTAARRLEPWVPTSAEYRREQLRAAVEADNLRRTQPAPQLQDVTPADEVMDAEIVGEGGE